MIHARARTHTHTHLYKYVPVWLGYPTRALMLATTVTRAVMLATTARAMYVYVYMCMCVYTHTYLCDLAMQRAHWCLQRLHVLRRSSSCVWNMYIHVCAYVCITNHSTTLANNSSVSFMRHDVQKYSSDVLYNIYIIYISVKSLSHLIFFKFFYEVISIINKKKTVFKGFTRGDPWVPCLTKQNLNRTQKFKVIALKK
jgi:hypothetical protein